MPINRNTQLNLKTEKGGMVKRNMKEIKYNNKTYKIPKPFDECFFGKNPTEEHTIINPYSDQSKHQETQTFSSDGP